MVTVIKPDLITGNETQTVSADLAKFDVAKQQCALTVQELNRFSVVSTAEQCDEAQLVLKTAALVVKAIEAKRTAFVKPFNDEVKKVNAYAKELSQPVEAGVSVVKQALLAYQKEEERKAIHARLTQRQSVLTALGFEYNAASNTFKIDDVGSISMAECENYDDKSFNTIVEGFKLNIQRKAELLLHNIQEEVGLVTAFGDETDKAHMDSVAQQAEQMKAAASATFTTPPAVKPAEVKGITKRWVHEVTNIADVPREYLVVDDAAIRKAVAAGVREIPGVKIFQTESITVR